MKIILIVLLCCFIPLSCRTMPKFTENELSEYLDLCLALEKVDFTCGSNRNLSELELAKVLNDPFRIEKSYFSIKSFSSIREKIRSVSKDKNSIFIIFLEVPSGWCSAVVYMPQEDEYLIKRAELFIKLDENLYYFEGEV